MLERDKLNRWSASPFVARILSRCVKSRAANLLTDRLCEIVTSAKLKQVYASLAVDGTCKKKKKENKNEKM